MKAQTGLKTVQGKTRHTPQVVLFAEDYDQIRFWLPEGSVTRAELDRCMIDARNRADDLNAKLEEDAQI